MNASFTAIERLQVALNAVCPNDGFALNGTTVARLDLQAQATVAQRAAASAVVAAFDWSPAADAAYLDAQEPLLKDLQTLATGAIAAIDTYLATADLATAAQVRAEVKALDQRQKKILQALARIVERTWR